MCSLKSIVFLFIAVSLSLSVSAQFSDTPLNTNPFGDGNGAFGERVVEHKGYADRKNIKVEQSKTDYWTEKNSYNPGESYLLNPNVDRTKYNRPQSSGVSDNVSYGRSKEAVHGSDNVNIAVPSVSLPGLPSVVDNDDNALSAEPEDLDVVGFEDRGPSRPMRVQEESPNDPQAPVSDGLVFMLLLAAGYALFRRRI